MHVMGFAITRGIRVAVCLLLAAALFIASATWANPARSQEDQGNAATGPIDPVAGAWMTYRGERTVAGEPQPQAFSLRVTYEFPPGAPPDGKVLDAAVTETGPEGEVVSSRTFSLQTNDRIYSSQDGAEEGYWLYWLAPGLDKDDTANVESATELKVVEVQDFDFRGNVYGVAKMSGSGVELLVERRTGLVFRIAREGGETLQIEDTNMLAHYPAWGYCLDDAAVGGSLADLAEEYPDLVEVSSLGKSAKGRDIWVAHVTDFTSNEPKRTVVMDAAAEGDAPEGCSFLLEFLEELVREAGEGEESLDLLRQLSIYVVPLVNPDGARRWLAMPDPAESLLIAGQAPRNGNLVNINRNFDMRWEEGSRDPSTWDYAGPAAFSEPESQAIGRLLEDVPADLYLSLHTGGDLINAPWNWSEDPGSNPERSFYQGLLADLSQTFPFPYGIGASAAPFTGSSTDWAYEGNGASSPICFDLYMHRPAEGELADDNGGLLSVYPQHREAISFLMENLQSYLAVDIMTSEIEVEVNVPIDAVVEITVSGKRALPNVTARLILPEDSGLKFSSMAEKEVGLGDLEPGSSAKVTWSLEGRTSGSSTATVVVTSTYPGYDHIPGTYGAEVRISISTHRTLLVLILLSALILLVLGMVFLSMRKHRRASGRESRAE